MKLRISFSKMKKVYVHLNECSVCIASNKTPLFIVLSLATFRRAALITRQLINVVANGYFSDFSFFFYSEINGASLRALLRLIKGASISNKNLGQCFIPKLSERNYYGAAPGFRSKLWELSCLIWKTLISELLAVDAIFLKSSLLCDIQLILYVRSSQRE